MGANGTGWDNLGLNGTCGKDWDRMVIRELPRNLASSFTSQQCLEAFSGCCWLVLFLSRVSSNGCVQKYSQYNTEENGPFITSWQELGSPIFLEGVVGLFQMYFIVLFGLKLLKKKLVVLCFVWSDCFGVKCFLNCLSVVFALQRY
jgi:hypothetical protein